MRDDSPTRGERDQTDKNFISITNLPPHADFEDVMTLFPRMRLSYEKIKLTKNGDTKQAVVSVGSQSNVEEALQQNNIHYQDFRLTISVASREDFEGR